MIVIDGSALVVAVVDTTGRGEGAQDMLLAGAVAPHLIDAEVGQAVRGLVLRGRLDPAFGSASLRAAEALVSERHQHSALGSRAWELRHDVSFYDGLYVALAEATGYPLVTADTRLAAAHGPRCAIELV